MKQKQQTSLTARKEPKNIMSWKFGKVGAEKDSEKEI